MHCECPETANAPGYIIWMYDAGEVASMYHKPNECKCTSELKRYKRGDQILTLCSGCCQFEDIEIDD